ncbi:RNA polymerase sigma-70 factor, ECF subfamily [Dyadobacter soli]|uniref:RNA polymerase sigma-70 factor, ECF subfamily n=1 Tax=Dyadobacter soli TaxID=659014 RepID=A0A1G8CTG9_9BACT|nr:RNA polymerase sigma-70 factor, ECF subfamily [Dyadobacter soli]
MSGTVIFQNYIVLQQPLHHPVSNTSPLPVQDTPSPNPVRDDEHLIRLAFATDPVSGCELLFRRYYAPLRNHAVRFVYSRQIAEDLVSDVFCTFWDNKLHEQITTSYRAYLFKAVRNRARNYVLWELKKDSNGAEEGLLLTDNSPGPDGTLLLEELRMRLDQSIQNLPNQCRKVFLLSRLEGKSYREIADQTNLSVRTVEVHIRKALSTIRQGLNNEWMLLFLFYWVR